MIEIIKKLLMKNRTIVTADVTDCMDIVNSYYPLKLHKYPTGSEYQTWVIPPEWNVIKGQLTVDDKVIASHDESPLFVARYSLPFNGVISKEELLGHAFTYPNHPEAYGYEFRLAYNYQRRLKDWRISVPYSRLQSIPETSKIHVEIEVETKPGNMIIGESSHVGSGEFIFVMLAHYCHVAQANDGLAGVAVMLEAIQKIKEKYPNSRLSYKALIMPETIGSSVYAAENEIELDRMIGGVFSEMGGADSPLQLVFSRRGDTYIDRVFLHVLNSKGKLPCRFIPFRKGWGNDELVFDSPGLGVPVVSLDRHPFEAYHTHFDNMDLIKIDKLDEIVDILVGVAEILEKDFIPKPMNRVPIYLTRYNLYADWTSERKQYDINSIILDNLWTGLSLLDVCLKYDLDFDMALGYLTKLNELKLVEKSFVTPEYSRTIRFLPSFITQE